MAEKHLGLKSKLIENAIPNMGLYFKNSKDASKELKIFYEMLNEFDSKMIGGKIPSEDMYYEN